MRPQGGDSVPLEQCGLAFFFFLKAPSGACLGVIDGNPVPASGVRRLSPHGGLALVHPKGAAGPRAGMWISVSCWQL